MSIKEGKLRINVWSNLIKLKQARKQAQLRKQRERYAAKMADPVYAEAERERWKMNKEKIAA